MTTYRHRWSWPKTLQFIKEGIKYMRVKEFTTPEAQNTPTQLFSGCCLKTITTQHYLFYWSFEFLHQINPRAASCSVLPFLRLRHAAWIWTDSKSEVPGSLILITVSSLISSQLAKLIPFTSFSISQTKSVCYLWRRIARTMLCSFPIPCSTQKWLVTGCAWVDLHTSCSEERTPCNLTECWMKELKSAFECALASTQPTELHEHNECFEWLSFQDNQSIEQ